MPETKVYSDTAVIQAIRENEDGAVGYFYKVVRGKAAAIIRSYGVEAGDVIEIYQQSFSILIEKVRSHDFQLTVKLSTYFIGICKFQALALIKKKQKQPVLNKITADLNEVSYEAPDTEQETRWRIMLEEYEKMKLIKKDCYKLISLSLEEKRSGSTIARMLGMKDEYVVKTQKGRCLKYLRIAVFNRLNNG